MAIPQAAPSKRARDVMVRNLVTVRPDTDVAAGLSILLKNGYSGTPVVEEDGTYHGVFSEKCCMRVLCDTAGLVGDTVAPPPCAGEFMTRKLLTVRPEQDVFEVIAQLIRNRVSGAPVTDAKGNFLGSFSEKTSMKVLIDSMYEGLPSAEVGNFMDRTRDRVIDEGTDLLSVARIFIETSFRRLPVLRDGRVLGQISRRDVLRSSRIIDTIVRHRMNVDDGPATADEPGQVTIRLIAAHDQLPSTAISTFMDATARTIDEDLDLLAIAQIFLTTPYRRLPVLRDGKCVGQVSRRDLLAAAYKLTDPPSPSESGILYLSATRDRSEMPSS